MAISSREAHLSCGKSLSKISFEEKISTVSEKKFFFNIAIDQPPSFKLVTALILIFNCETWV